MCPIGSCPTKTCEPIDHRIVHTNAKLERGRFHPITCKQKQRHWWKRAELGVPYLDTKAAAGPTTPNDLIGTAFWANSVFKLASGAVEDRNTYSFSEQ